MNTITIAVFIGTTLAIATVVVVLRLLHGQVQQTDASLRPRWAVAISYTTAVISFPFAWWIAFIIGGNFGGAIAAEISERSHTESVWVPFGIGIGIAVITMSIVLALSLSAFWITRVIERK